MQPLEEIYQSHARTVYHYLLSLTRDADLSEELTQEVFYQAVKNISRFDGSCKVSTWLCAIAKNQLRVYQRKHPSNVELEPSAAVSCSSEQDALGNIGAIELLKKIHALDPEKREILYLRIFGGLSFREIGDVLGRTENWARVMYYRGKESLKKELEADEPETEL